MIDVPDGPLVGVMERFLSGRSSVISGFVPNTRSNMNYMNKVTAGSQTNHEFLVKLDEDVLLTSDGWDKFFSTILSMREDSIACTGAISNGVPTCDIFVKNFIPESKTELDAMFANTYFPLKPKGVDYFGGADYTSLNETDGKWNSDRFFEKVHKIEHVYKGIHPVRVNVDAQKKINEKILSGFPKTMQPIDANIIKDVDKYPYFCNSAFGIKAKDWRMILSRRDLFVDNTDEVPLNRFRHETGRNLMIDTGIPMLHTMYNWAGFEDSSNWEYENQLVKKIVTTFDKVY